MKGAAIYRCAGGSGGCLSHRSFRSNPAFAVISAPGVRDTLWLTLTHADQRGQNTELGSGGPKKISYEPCGFTVLVPRSSDLGNDMIGGSALIPHEAVCRNLFAPAGTPSFRNQRDVTLKLALGRRERDAEDTAPSVHIIVPSTHDPSDNAPTILSFVSTTGTTKVLPLLPRPQQAEENTVSSSVSSCSSSRRVELLRPSDSVNLTCIISKDGSDADGTTTRMRVYVLWYCCRSRRWAI